MINERRLGRTGLSVSEVGYGAWGIGGSMWLGAEDQVRTISGNRLVSSNGSGVREWDLYDHTPMVVTPRDGHMILTRLRVGVVLLQSRLAHLPHRGRAPCRVVYRENAITEAPGMAGAVRGRVLNGRDYSLYQEADPVAAGSVDGHGADG